MATFTAAPAGFRNVDPNFVNDIAHAHPAYGANEIAPSQTLNSTYNHLRLQGALQSTSDLFDPVDLDPGADGTRYVFHLSSVDYFDFWDKGNVDPSDDVYTFAGTLSGLDLEIVLDQWDNAIGPQIGNLAAVRTYLGSLPLTIEGSGGHDLLWLISGRNDDPIWTFGENDDVFNGGSGNDSFSANAGDDTLYGQDGSDWLRGDAGADLIHGDNGNDHIEGAWDWYYNNHYSGSWSAAGPDLADRIYGGNGNDYADGGDGNDSIYGENGNDYLVGGLGNDHMVGGNNDDSLLGGQGNDLMYGQAGNDSLYGDAGNDTMAGGAGADHFEGGEGVDTVSYLGATAGIAMTSDSAAYGTGGDALGDNANAVEVFGGSNFADTLIGWDSPDTFYGFAGNDLLTGGLANDRLDGGADLDTVGYADAAGAVTVTLLTGYASGAAGLDRLLSIENVTGSAFNDALIGNTGANTLDGGLGNDVLTGGGAGDRLIGGDGYDTAAYRGAMAGVSLSLESGGSSGEALGDSFTGIERVWGSEHADLLAGAAAAEALHGFGGSDTLSGGGGNDYLVGGAGDDRFVLSPGSDGIADFAAGDVLDLSALLGGLGLAASGAALDDYLQVTNSGSASRLRVDLDGLGGFGSPEAQATLAGVSLAAAGLSQAQLIDSVLAAGMLDL